MVMITAGYLLFAARFFGEIIQFDEYVSNELFQAPPQGGSRCFMETVPWWWRNMEKQQLLLIFCWENVGTFAVKKPGKLKKTNKSASKRDSYTHFRGIKLDANMYDMFEGIFLVACLVSFTSTVEEEDYFSPQIWEINMFNYKVKPLGFVGSLGNWRLLGGSSQLVSG